MGVMRITLSRLPPLNSLRAFVVASFLAIGQNTAVAWLLGFLLVAGLVLAWSPLGLDEFRRRAAAQPRLQPTTSALVTLL